MYQNYLKIWVPFSNGDYEDKGISPSPVTAWKDSVNKDTNFISALVGGKLQGGAQIDRDRDTALVYENVQYKKIPTDDPYARETFCIWYKYYNDTVENPGYTQQLVGDHYNHIIDVWLDSTTLIAKVEGYSISPNVWHHIVLERHLNTAARMVTTIYIDGEKRGSSTASTTGTYGYRIDNELWLLGQRISGTCLKYTYCVSDFRYYGTSLTAEEIKAMWEDNLIAHYSLNHQPPQGATVEDNKKGHCLTKYNLTAYCWDAEEEDYYLQVPALVASDNLRTGRSERHMRFYNYPKYVYLIHPSIFQNIDMSSKNMTFCCWYRWGGNGILFEIGTNRGTIRIDNEGSWDKMQFVEHTPSGGDKVIDLGYLGSSSSLHHLAVVYDGNQTYSIYEDGEFIKDCVCQLGGTYPTYPYDTLAIGWEYNISPSYVYGDNPEGTGWLGEISDFRIYSGSLTQDQIKELVQENATFYLDDNTLCATEFIETQNNEVAVCPTLSTVTAKDFIEHSAANTEWPSIDSQLSVNVTELKEW